MGVWIVQLTGDTFDLEDFPTLHCVVKGLFYTVKPGDAARMQHLTFEDKRLVVEILRVSVTVKDHKATVSCLCPSKHALLT